MTLARRHQFDPGSPPWVHAISRCVRRAFLAGDRYEHRKSWVAERLRLLAGVFAVEVAGFSVMSNHLHLVVRMLPGRAAGWSDDEVVRRWWTAYPVKFLADGTGILPDEAQIRQQAGDAAWVAVRRQRLGDLGWLMKALKENISRRANREDQCSGAFWEGRYVSVPLLDQAALTACMAYVDLNPVRAKVAATPEDSDFTSVQTRIRARDRAVKAARLQATATTPAQLERARRMLVRVGLSPTATGPEDGLWLTPVASCGESGLSLDDYLSLVDATGKTLATGKRGRIDPRLAPILARLDLRVEDWLASMLGWRMFAGVGALGSWAVRRVEAARRGVAWIRTRCPLFAMRAA